jgi:hypothetical protein
LTDEEATQEVLKIIEQIAERRIARSDILSEFKHRFPDTRYAVWADGQTNIGTSAKKYVSKACRALEQQGIIKRVEEYIEVM